MTDEKWASVVVKLLCLALILLTLPFLIGIESVPLSNKIG